MQISHSFNKPELAQAVESSTDSRLSDFQLYRQSAYRLRGRVETDKCQDCHLPEGKMGTLTFNKG